MSKRVAVVGATGAVGEEILSILEQRDFPLDELCLFSSKRSAGTKLSFKGDELEVKELTRSSFDGIDLALFSAGGSISKEFAPIAVQAGTCVIDNSSAFRMDDDVPLVIPEINGEKLKGRPLLIANPNCTTIILLMVLGPLHKRYGVRRGIISTYQAASGAGRDAMEELRQQTERLLENKPVFAEHLPAPLGFNLIPHCDDFLENGYTKEEMKVVNESRKILEAPDLPLSVTAVRVPILRAHSESATVELERPYDLDELSSFLEQLPGVRLLDRPGYGGYPMPLLSSGRDSVMVGRLRRDPTVENGLVFFVSGDQLRKGAALNAVQIAEMLESESS